MRTPIRTTKTLAVVIAIVGVLAMYFTIARPWFLSWGATRSEITASRPGDARVPRPAERTVRAVTIRAPASAVWPWLAQVGQDRGGFYSYEVLEDLVGCEMPRAQSIHAEHQQWREGDQLWMYPPRKLGGVGGAPLVECEPGRHLVFATRQLGTPTSRPPDAIWGFSLEPIDSRSTRLIAWGKAPGEGHPAMAAINRFVFEPAHYVMERRMLLNIKELAEGRIPSRSSENVAVALWILTVIVLLGSLVLVGRRSRWQEPLAVAVIAAIVFQALTLLQPPLVPSIAILTLVSIVLFAALGGGAIGRGLAPSTSPSRVSGSGHGRRG